MKPNLFNAHIVLRELLLGKEPVPFTPIQAFGLPLNEFYRPLVASPASNHFQEDCPWQK